MLADHKQRLIGCPSIQYWVNIDINSIILILE